MGRIEDNKKRAKDTDSNPLKEFGNRNEKTNKFDIDDKTIKKQKNKE